MTYRSNIWKLAGFWFFQGLIFAYIIERLFGVERGLSIQDMVWVEITYGVVYVLLEVPTGAIADRWSRRNLLIGAAFFVFFEMWFLVFAEGLSLFLASSVSAAIAGVLVSGTFNALLYDSLKADGLAHTYEKTKARINFIDATAGISGALVGSLVAARYGLTAPYVLSLGSVVIGFLFALTIKDPPIRTSTGEVGFWKHMTGAAKFAFGHAQLRSVILFAAIVASAWVYVDEYWQLYASAVAFPVILFGLYGVSHQGGAALSSLFVDRFKERLTYRHAFGAGLVISIACITFAALIHSPWSLIPLLVMNAAFYVLEPLWSGFLHHRTPSEMRATVESVQSLVLHVAGALVGLAFGWIATRWSIFAGFGFLAAVLAAYLPYYLLTSRRFEGKAETEEEHPVDETPLFRED